MYKLQRENNTLLFIFDIIGVFFFNKARVNDIKKSDSQLGWYPTLIFYQKSY